jgi:hypothetical protein
MTLVVMKALCGEASIMVGGPTDEGDMCNYKVEWVFWRKVGVFVKWGVCFFFFSGVIFFEGELKYATYSAVMARPKI